MHYFVTGATGFIGKRLVRKLLARRGSVVYFLIRQESQDKIDGYSTTGARARREQYRSSATCGHQCWVCLKRT
jgi:thioester reductase-like protein